MLRASIILKNTREDKSYELSEVAKKTKISIKYLRAIENESKDDLPSEPYTSLIIKDYAAFLGLNGDDILSLYRRDFVRRTKKISGSLVKSGLLTPQYVFRLASLFLVAIFAAYLYYEYQVYHSPPRLEVNWPDTGGSKNLEITGTTDSESTVRVNQDLILVNPDGTFTTTVDLSKSGNKITVESRSPGGKTTLVEKTYN